MLMQLLRHHSGKSPPTWPHSVHSFSARSSLDTVDRLRSSTGLPLQRYEWVGRWVGGWG